MYIIKIGGNVIDNPEALGHFLDIFAAIEVPKALVHGGGKIATEISKSLGIEAKMVDGRRITDDETIKVVTQVYGGLINKQIVAGLQARGCNAVGLTGADGNVIHAHKRPVKDVDYGWVGDVDGVDADLLHVLAQRGLTPVLAPLTHDGQGHMLNTNADTIASEAACGMAGLTDVSLVYCFELAGVMGDINDPSSLITEITPSVYEKLKADGVVNKGMIPKLDNAFAALNRGVKRVIICRFEALAAIIEGKKEGTVITL